MDNVNLEGGIAIDDEENIYISNDGDGNLPSNVIFKLTPQGDLSILCTYAELNAVPGVGPDVDLDVGMAIDGSLYVGDDGDCDCILEIDPDTCSPEILITENEIELVAGNTSADLEGGLCIDTNMNLFLGDDGSRPGDGDRPSIVKIPAGNPLTSSLFVSPEEVRDFYSDIDPGGDPRFEGSCAVKLVDSPEFQVPTLSEWGLITMAAVLGLVGLMVARRRTVKA